MPNRYLPILLFISLVGCISEPKEWKGTIRNFNLVSGDTLIAIEPDNNSTPVGLTICGRHPELWEGEHVQFTAKYFSTSECWLISNMQRIGADR